MQKKRVLLIGGAGTLGSDILDANLSTYELFVIDNFSESALAEEELQGKVSYKNMSVTDENELRKIFQEFGPEVVIYLATTLSKDPVRGYESNVFGMANTIKAAEQLGKPYLIYIQSFLTRNCESLVKETSQVEANDSYATWKLAAEYLLGAYSGKSTTFILANVLSPRLSIGAIPTFVRKIQKHEQVKVTNTWRDYIDPDSFITALKSLMEDERNRSLEILGSSIAVNTVDILEFTALAMGSNLHSIKYEIVPQKFGDPTRVELDNSFSEVTHLKNNYLQQCISQIVQKNLATEKQSRLHH